MGAGRPAGARLRRHGAPAAGTRHAAPGGRRAAAALGRSDRAGDRCGRPPPARARSTVGRSAAGADAGRAPRRFPRAERAGATPDRTAAGERLLSRAPAGALRHLSAAAFYPTMRGRACPEGAKHAEHKTAGSIWHRYARARRKAGAGHRPEAGDRDRPADPLAAAQEQSRPNRRAGRRQDGHRGGRGAVSCRRDRAGAAARQAPLCAGHGQRHRRHKVPRRI